MNTPKIEIGAPVNTPFLAVPSYTPGHEFSGRSEELRFLTDWAFSLAEPVLVLEAIGGMGKSMLCWEWVNRTLRTGLPKFAGVFWYSFYERGADMSDFCANALAFVSGSPVAELRSRKTGALAAELIPVLRRAPWLFVLDGLERVLAAYNRYDAAQVRDDQVEAHAQSARRGVRDCIRPGDANLLLGLAEAAPSKILISSRLLPSALLDDSTPETPRVAHKMLSGLAPSDAEAMLKKLGVYGNSERIQRYLSKNFACHPLIVGVVGGLVRKSATAPGDFDSWVEQHARQHGTHSDADLVRRRIQILWAAFEDLDEDTRSLLARIALISEATDYETLVEVNPRRPAPPNPVYEPGEWLLKYPRYIEKYNNEKKAYDAYLSELVRWRGSVSYVEAGHFLRDAIQDLAARGLLQCDLALQKYDLHPVVRGYAVSSISPDQRERIGQSVVDCFSSRPDIESEKVTNLHEVQNGLQVSRTLIHMGRAAQAAAVIQDLAEALFWSLDAWHLYLSLVKPLFSLDWARPVSEIGNGQLAGLWNGIALALSATGSPEQAVKVGELALNLYIDLDRPSGVLMALGNLGVYAGRVTKMYTSSRIAELVATATPILGDEEHVALSYLDRSGLSADIGDFGAAERYWLEFDKLPRPQTRGSYRPGHAEYRLAYRRFLQGRLDEGLLALADQLAREGNNRAGVCDLFWLRGEWKLSLCEWAEAATFFEENIRMDREVDLDSSWSEARLALCQVNLGQAGAFLELADRLSGILDPPHLALAELYLALGERDSARRCAHNAYEEASREGAPYIYFLTFYPCLKVFEALGDPSPLLAPFDPANARPFSFEAKLLSYLEKKAEEKRTQGDSATQ